MVSIYTRDCGKGKGFCRQALSRRAFPGALPRTPEYFRSEEGVGGGVRAARSSKMERALVIGATGGIGGAVASALRVRGVAVTGLSRAEGLDLRATRLTEIAEMDDILAALEPHLTEAGNA